MRATQYNNNDNKNNNLYKNNRFLSLSVQGTIPALAASLLGPNTNKQKYRPPKIRERW